MHFWVFFDMIKCETASKSICFSLRAFVSDGEDDVTYFCEPISVWQHLNRTVMTVARLVLPGYYQSRCGPTPPERA